MSRETDIWCRMSLASNVLAILGIVRNVSWTVQETLSLVRSFNPADAEARLAAIDQKLDLLIGQTSGPETGFFIPPEEEPFMSVLQLEVGQTAVGVATFSEPTPPADGAVTSDTPAVATISLGSDMETWTCVGVSVGTATMTWTGTSAPPDVGPVQVAPMVVTVVAVPAAETGDFNPTGATITGP